MARGFFKKAGNFFRGLGKKVRNGIDSVKSFGKKVQAGADELGVGDVLRSVGKEAQEVARKQLGGVVGERGAKMLERGADAVVRGDNEARAFGRDLVQQGVRRGGEMLQDRLRRMRR